MAPINLDLDLDPPRRRSPIRRLRLGFRAHAVASQKDARVTKLPRSFSKSGGDEVQPFFPGC
ncbi:MAG: hypothetical protein QME96_16130, partial [Myxococcota bacterium]|nr:hypothetical protein [Myxococcota bacterium]